MINEGENRVEELKGGLRNALERGESLEHAKQSFVNAGYNKIEVDEAGKLLGEISPVPKQSSVVEKEVKGEPKLKVKEKLSSKKRKKKLRMPRKKVSSRILWIVTILISLMILVGAAILGLNWNKWFG